MKFVANLILLVLNVILLVLWLTGLLFLFPLGCLARFIGGERGLKPVRFNWNSIWYRY